MAILAEYHAAIGEIIIKYSGTPERYAGDGVMVIFNDPVPVDNPAPQAVLMAFDPKRTSALGLAFQVSWSDSVLQRITLMWPSGHPSNSAIRLNPAFS
jgi:class 3 adenylate cyclase